MTTSHPALARAEGFAISCHLRAPILLGPMAGACPVSLSIAVANAGGLGIGRTLPEQTMVTRLLHANR
jgi:nitronate monooxygenase